MVAVLTTNEGNDAAPSQATFLDGSTLTFAIANAGGLAVLLFLSAAFEMRVDDPRLVGTIAIVLGLLVIAVGTQWKAEKEERQGLARWQYYGGRLIIGTFNVAILGTALWGSLQIALKAAATASGQ